MSLNRCLTIVTLLLLLPIALVNVRIILTCTLENFTKTESDVVFVGLARLIDPPCPEVNPMDVCDQAGIQLIMITGDNKYTAEKIGTQIGAKISMKIGLFSKNESFENNSYAGTDFFQFE